MKGRIRTFIVDSFTDKPFKGNPAGVCVVKQAIPDKLMGMIANELGLSETAFIQKTDENYYSIRFFSPKMEIALCGHATLAASKVLFKTNPGLKTIDFRTVEGIKLQIKLEDESIIMQFPVYNTVKTAVPKELLEALDVVNIRNSEFNRETNNLLLEIESSKVLQALSPDFTKLKNSYESINGVVVTALSQREGFDFESRYFWPWTGTNEDPVTGSTHTFLTKYWSIRMNKKKMRSFQCSARTGQLQVELTGDHSLLIRGEAHIVFEGKIRVH